jgi:biopolymer transport protein ExbD
MTGSGRRPDDLLSDINVTPLVDVILVLLVVLMVSASAGVSRSLAVRLPQAGSGDARPATLELGIDAKGHWSIGGEPVEPGALARHLGALASPATTRAVIAADGAARHQSVNALLDLLGQTGISNVAFAVRRVEAP